MSFKIGIDGGGTKTEGILVDDAGNVVTRHVGPGGNPSVVGPERARAIVHDTLAALTAAAAGPVTASLLCMAGSRTFWTEFAAGLDGYGAVTALDDSLPVLELATHGAPGLALHAGTGSFVAARAPDGGARYAGGLGWRFGDAGSGYDLGRRAVSRALLELQGWAEPSSLGRIVRAHAAPGAAVDAVALTRFFYQHAEPNRVITGLAPSILQLAVERDDSARLLIIESVVELLELATHVALKTFPETPLSQVRAGLSGPILTHPVVAPLLAPHTPLTLSPVQGAPIEGVRRLLIRR